MNYLQEMLHSNIIQSIKKLSSNQIWLFSCACILRVLPYYSLWINEIIDAETKRGLDKSSYFKENDFQRKIYSIFYAMDYIFLLYTQIKRLNELDTQKKRLNEIFSVKEEVFLLEARTVSSRLKFAYEYDHDHPTSDIMKAIDVLLESLIYFGYGKLLKGFGRENCASVMDIVFAVVKKLDSKRMKAFQNGILEDLKSIKQRNTFYLHNYSKDFRQLWNYFFYSLRKIGCDYWASLYNEIYMTKFEINERELIKRLSVPDEIKDQGAAAVSRYLMRMGDDFEKLNEARIIVLGEKGAGKTSISRRLINVDAEMPGDYESTEGVTTLLWSFPDKEGNTMNVHLWDFAGHSITHSAHRCFMSARCLYIYVYNGRIERDNDPSYWLEQIRIHGGDSSILFLINEKDDHRVDIAERTLKREYPSIEGFYHIDIGSDDKTKLIDLGKR